MNTFAFGDWAAERERIQSLIIALAARRLTTHERAVLVGALDERLDLLMRHVAVLVMERDDLTASRNNLRSIIMSQYNRDVVAEGDDHDTVIGTFG